MNEYLIKHCGLDPLDATKTKSIGLVVASNANFYAPAGYPSLLHAGLRIVKLGRSSVTYRVGIFEGDKQQASVVGGFTHVFVDPVERRPVKGLPEEMLSGMRQLLWKLYNKIERFSSLSIKIPELQPHGQCNRRYCFPKRFFYALVFLRLWPTKTSEMDIILSRKWNN